MWATTVPNRFVLICFEAVHHRLFTVGQARALCDLYQAKYDMVLAAWEVYKVQNDMRDFTDTLRRVVRDFSFDEEGAAEDEAKQKTGTAASHAKASEERREGEADSKRAAMQAVISAKLDLLKHSLEMMVKQELTTEPNATRLFERAKAGDVLVDAAIESYATDRDVADFLDTLQILANHSVEELDTFLRAASADQQQQAPAPRSAANAPSDLRAIVTEMVRIGILLGNEETALLLDLVDRKDGRVMAAYESYANSHDKEDLFDTLFRIVSIEINAKKPSGAAKAPTPEKASPASQHAPTAEASAARPARLLTAADQKTVVDILAKASALTADQVALLNAKIDKEDAYLQNIFSKYEEDKDVYSLIDLLRSIKTYDSYNEDEEEDDEKVDDDDDEEEDDGDDDDYEEEGENEEEDEEVKFSNEERQTIESRFLQIVQDMELTQMETAALRLAIARNDQAIRDSLEAFRSSLDDRTLVSSLKSIARRVIVEMLQETEANAEAEEDKGDDDDDDDDDDEEEDDDEEDDEDGEEDDEDDEDDDEDSESNRSKMHESIFPLLVHELEKAKIVSARDGEVLMCSFAAKNPTILGALDLYDSDQNLNNLVVTLKKVSNASQ